MNRLVFARRGWTSFRERLLASSPYESAAILLARTGQGLTGRRFLVTDVIHADDHAYLSRSEFAATLQPSFVAKALQRARNEKLSIFLVHTHPFDDAPHFSSKDGHGERELAPTLYRRATPGPHGALVVGRNGFRAHTFNSFGQWQTDVERICEAGDHVQVYVSGAFEPQLDSFFDRNVRTFGRAGQQVLRQLTVAVVGVGGTGSIVVEELARLGVGKLVLIDDERLESTNLNRVIGSRTEDVSSPKVDVMRRVAKTARGDIDVASVFGSAIEEAVARRLLDCDIVFCCTDTHGSRAILNQIAYQYFLPTFDVGVRIDAQDERVTSIVTRVQMLSPGIACLVCSALLDPVAVRRDLMTEHARAEDPYIVGFQEPQPAVISINAVASSAAVTMFLTAVTGLPGASRHQIGRPLDGVSRPVVTKQNPACVVCGRENAFGRADSWPMFWRPTPNAT